MRDKNESVLRAGLLLRKMGELADQAEQNRTVLHEIQEQARAVQEKWQALMQEMNDEKTGESVPNERN